MSSVRLFPLLLSACLWALTLVGCPVAGEGVADLDAPCEPGQTGQVVPSVSSECQCGEATVPLVGQPLPGIDLVGPPRSGGALRVLLYSNLPSLMYLTHSDAWIAYILQHSIYESLVRQHPKTYAYEPELAESWERNDAGTEWTFHLRQGVTWHDGAPFTAEDVLFTFETILSTQNRTEHMRSIWQDSLAPVEPLEVVDSHTFRLRLKRPVFTVLQDLSDTTIIPEHIFSRGEFNTHPNLREPVGTGPLRFVSWDSEAITVERNEAYWGQKAYLDRVVYKIVTDFETAFLMLQRGDLDFMTRMQPHQRAEGVTPELLERFNLTEYVPSAYAYTVYNTKLSLFSDARVRQALTLLNPTDRIICEIYQCQGTRVTGPLPQTHPAYDTSLPPWPYDPQRAMALLEEAGWTDTDGDGIRDKEVDGQRVPFRFTYLTTASSRALEQQVTIYQSAARRAGVDVRISKLDWSVFIERVRKKDFEVASLRWLLSHENDPYNLFHSAGGQNYSGFANAEADSLMETARYLLDDTARNVLYKRLHKVIYEEQPYSFIYTPTLPGLIDKRFAGVYTSDNFFQWRDIWLNDASLPLATP